MASNKELRNRALELARQLGIDVDPKGNHEQLQALVADLEVKVAEASLGDIGAISVDVLVNGGPEASVNESHPAGAGEFDEDDEVDDDASADATDDEEDAAAAAPVVSPNESGAGSTAPKINPIAPDTSARRTQQRERERLIVAARADKAKPTRYVVAPGKAITSARGQILRGKENAGDIPDRVTVEDFMRRRSDDRAAAEARIAELVERGFLVRE